MSEHWYVVESDVGKVFQAQLSLAVSGLKIWLPVIIKRPAHRGKNGKPVRDIRIPRFGRYFFVHCEMTDSTWSAIKNARYVWRVITAGSRGRPSVVDPRAVEWLMADVPVEIDTSQGPAYNKGDMVRLVEGPFEGQIGPVQGVDNRGSVCITLDIFGGSTPLVVESHRVELVTKALAQPARPRKEFPPRAACHQNQR